MACLHDTGMNKPADHHAVQAEGHLHQLKGEVMLAAVPELALGVQ